MLDREREEIAHVFPQVLPGEQSILFTILNEKGPNKSEVVVQSLSTGARRVLLQGVSRARYVSSGHLVFAQGPALLAAPFDLARLAIAGTPVVVVDGVSSAATAEGARFAVAEEGTLVYAPHIRTDQQTLVWVDRTGREAPLGAPPRAYAHPLRQATIGDRRVESLFSRGLGLWPGSWTPDGRALSYMEMNGAGTGGDLSVFEPGAAAPHRPFLRETTTEWGARLSPDGRWMAYISNQSGRWEAYLRPFPGPGGQVQVSGDGGTEVVWATGGGELFYRHGDGVFAVPVRTEPTLSVGKPQRLFAGPYTKVLPGVANYDVSRDATRLLMVKPGPEETTPRTLRFVLNWPGRLTRPEGLRQRALP